MTNNRNNMAPMPDTAKILKQRLATSFPRREPAATVDDAFAQAVGKQLAAKGIAHVQGLPQEPEPEWYDKAIELGRQHDEFEHQREAERQAELEAQNAPQTLPDLIRQMVGKPAVQADARTVPANVPALNSDAILRAALGGGHGTINGRPA